MSFTTFAERSTMLQDMFNKNPSSQERAQIDLDLGEADLDPITFISFCPFEWQSMLMAIATPTDIHIYKVFHCSYMPRERQISDSSPPRSVGLKLLDTTDSPVFLRFPSRTTYSTDLPRTVLLNARVYAAFTRKRRSSL